MIWKVVGQACGHVCALTGSDAHDRPDNNERLLGLEQNCEGPVEAIQRCRKRLTFVERAKWIWP